MGRRPGCNQPRRTPRTITLNIANSSETSKKYMPANAAAAMVLCRGPRRALLATLWRAITTRAITAGVTPLKNPVLPRQAAAFKKKKPYGRKRDNERETQGASATHHT